MRNRIYLACLVFLAAGCSVARAGPHLLALRPVVTLPQGVDPADSVAVSKILPLPSTDERIRVGVLQIPTADPILVVLGGDLIGVLEKVQADWEARIAEAERRRDRFRAWGDILRISTRVGTIGGGGGAVYAGAGDRASTAAISGGIAALAGLFNWMFGGEKWAMASELCGRLVALRADLSTFVGHWRPKLVELTPSSALRQQFADALEDFGKSKINPAYRSCEIGTSDSVQ